MGQDFVIVLNSRELFARSTISLLFAFSGFEAERDELSKGKKREREPRDFGSFKRDIHWEKVIREPIFLHDTKKLRFF